MRRLTLVILTVLGRIGSLVHSDCALIIYVDRSINLDELRVGSDQEDPFPGAVLAQNLWIHHRTQRDNPGDLCDAFNPIK